MKRPNPYPTHLMSPAERRAELCAILALGLLRLRMAANGEVPDGTGESSLHFPPDQWRHATPTHRRDT